jgi:Major capsid protein N-terminus/Large eukaryotic DNA virus major capsid protein
MDFTSSNLDFGTLQTRTLSCRVDRYAQLLYDTYLMVTLPDIWSPMVAVSIPPSGYDASCTAMGYEFQWIKNIGYNLIDHVDIVMNGVVIQSLTGEWLKMYSYMTHDVAKRRIVDQMVGNVKDVYDPANAYDRTNQYPHAVTPTTLPTTMPFTTTPEPSIRSRQLVIPLHFWFCENPGLALPLVSLQNSEVYINVTLRPLNQLYSIVDVVQTSPTYGQRIQPTGSYPIGLFLSAPNTVGVSSQPAVTTFFANPYLEGNFIYLTDMEMNQLAAADQTFLLKQVRLTHVEGQYGPNTDILVPMFNMVTRIVFTAQRSDKVLTNDWDNYTNWANPNRAPFSGSTLSTGDLLYSSGQYQISSVSPRDAVTNGVLLFDGNERFTAKPTQYFSLIQQYKHTTGEQPSALPGLYMYSFALNHDNYQPSGALNASMFNKVVLRVSLQQPLPTAVGAGSQSVVCVLRSTALSQNPLVISNPQAKNPDGSYIYPQDQLISVVKTVANNNIIFSYTYAVGVYVESINYLRIVSGLANLVFAN